MGVDDDDDDVVFGMSRSIANGVAQAEWWLVLKGEGQPIFYPTKRRFSKLPLTH